MLKREHIAALLPHGDGMCLLDTVEHHDENGIRCSFRIGETHPLRRDNRLSSIISLEYGAQAVGLWAALRQGLKQKPAEGYVLAVRNFELHRAVLPEGETLTVTVEKKLLGKDSAICRFRLCSDLDAVAEGQLTLMMRPA